MNTLISLLLTLVLLGVLVGISTGILALLPDIVTEGWMFPATLYVGSCWVAVLFFFQIRKP